MFSRRFSWALFLSFEFIVWIWRQWWAESASFLDASYCIMISGRWWRGCAGVQITIAAPYTVYVYFKLITVFPILTIANKTTNSVLLRLCLHSFTCCLTRKWSQGDIEKYIIEMFRCKVRSFNCWQGTERVLRFAFFLLPLSADFRLILSMTKTAPNHVNINIRAHESLSLFFLLFTSKIRLYL